MKVAFSLSIAEVNCLIEAIAAANRAVAAGQVVYAADGYESHKLSEQLMYAGITTNTAVRLAQLVEDEEVTLIAFEP